VGDGGRAWLAEDERRFAPIALETTEHLERVLGTADGYVIGGGNGTVWTSADGRRFTATRIAEQLAWSEIAPFRGGLLLGGYRLERAPNRALGALLYLGDPARVPTPRHAPRTALPVPEPPLAARPPPIVEVLGDRARWPAELTVDALRAALDAGLDPNAATPYRGGAAPLGLAVAAASRAEPLASLEVIDLLIERGADVNALDAHDRTR
jgi:hypothetical protein